MEIPIREEIYLNHHQPEWLIAIPQEVTYHAIATDIAKTAPMALLVYRFDRMLNRSDYKYAYRFTGVRISGPVEASQADAVVCPSCKSTNTYLAIICVNCGAHNPPRW